MSVIRVACVFTALGLFVACDTASAPPTVAPSALPGADSASAAPAAASASSGAAPALAPAASAAGRLERLVTMLDACDPDTFNAVLGPGSCIRSGGMRFETFIAELTRHAVAGPWRFSPDVEHVTEGTTLVATNRGGEVHTFTEVENFGGGIVPSLNELAHVPEVAPECAALAPDSEDFVPPGGMYREEVGETGTVKFQCCIHPWMKLEAQVASR